MTRRQSPCSLAFQEEEFETIRRKTDSRKPESHKLEGNGVPGREQRFSRIPPRQTDGRRDGQHIFGHAITANRPRESHHTPNISLHKQDGAGEKCEEKRCIYWHGTNRIQIQKLLLYWLTRGNMLRYIVKCNGRNQLWLTSRLVKLD